MADAAHTTRRAFLVGAASLAAALPVVATAPVLIAADHGRAGDIIGRYLGCGFTLTPDLQRDQIWKSVYVAGGPTERELEIVARLDKELLGDQDLYDSVLRLLRRHYGIQPPVQQNHLAV